MSFFAYRQGRLTAESVPLARIAEAAGTPFYCYSSAAIVAQHRAVATAFAGRRAMICYSLKANSNQAVIATLARRGAGADVVSLGELKRALAAGVPPQKIVFAGIGKTKAEMIAGLEAGILQFSVESLPELHLLDEVASARGQRAPVALRINPDVDARTHAKISTGKAENKFGIDLGHAAAAYRAAASMPGIEIVGITVHIGSQLTEATPYRTAFERLAALARELRAEGLAIRRLALGGGLGIPYGSEPPLTLAEYAGIVGETVGDLDLPVILEPGRFLVGNAGVLVTRVLYVKEGATRTFLILDAAMNDLMRPALYDAYHDIVTVSEPQPDAPRRPYDLVGPVCESADTFARDRPLPPVRAGDLLAIRSAGAYGAVMSSSYNSRPPAPEIMVHGADFAIVRPRLSYDLMIGQDRLPDWLGADEAGTRPARVMA